MTKKCKCKKCVYCKQIITGTPIFRVNCAKYGDGIYLPTYCDQYVTEEEFAEKKAKEKFKAELREYVELLRWEILRNK